MNPFKPTLSRTRSTTPAVDDRLATLSTGGIAPRACARRRGLLAALAGPWLGQPLRGGLGLGVGLNLGLGLGAAGAQAAGNGGLAAPSGKVVLSISGRIERHNAGNRADFDMAMLEALPQHSFTTQTPWFPQARQFSGPLLREVLASAGVSAAGQTLQAVALNNYKIDLPLEDTQKFKVLLATRLDGKPMPVREKGPLFIIYPFDEAAELRSERYYSRSAWQLRSIEVK